MRAAHAAAQKKMASEIDALNKEVQEATEKATQEASAHGAAPTHPVASVLRAAPVEYTVGLLVVVAVGRISRFRST